MPTPYFTDTNVSLFIQFSGVFFSPFHFSPTPSLNLHLGQPCSEHHSLTALQRDQCNPQPPGRVHTEVIRHGVTPRDALRPPHSFVLTSPSVLQIASRLNVIKGGEGPLHSLALQE